MHHKPLEPLGLDTWRARPSKRLASIDASSTPGAPGERPATEKQTEKLRERLRLLQSKLIAEQNRSVLVVLQAMDCGGKDGTVKSLYAGMNPTAATVYSFGVPTAIELAHDFLWRIHAQTPARGHITIFNRSQYEDVLAVPVRNLAPKSVWEPRFEAINDFERDLFHSGTVVVKIMLHISLDEQRERLQERIDRPDKRWKFRMGDVEDRALWPDYQRAYERVFRLTSTDYAPWYVVPADRKWYRDFATATILVRTLEAMHLAFPKRPDIEGFTVT